MSHAPAADFLLALGQALSAMTLYGPGHPARATARERARTRLQTAMDGHAPLRFTFLDDDVIVGRSVLHDMQGWDWGQKFAAIGVQRMEFSGTAGPFAADLDAMLERIHGARAPSGVLVTGVEQFGDIRIGPVGLLGGNAPTPALSLAIPAADARVLSEAFADEVIADLAVELDAVRWIHEQSAMSSVPIGEVEAVVRGLALAMQREHRLLLPLLPFTSTDEYNVTHACNVSTLAMGLAETVGFASSDVRAVGTAALTHDIGKVKIAPELLVKSGPLTAEEMTEMQRHPVEGARMLGEKGHGNALAAIVAYEHHIWDNGAGGYPVLRFPRRTHYVSQLVHVCDVYDALSTRRPYRDAWPRERTVQLLRSEAGGPLDASLVEAFLLMLERCDTSRIAAPSGQVVVTENRPSTAADPLAQ